MCPLADVTNSLSALTHCRFASSVRKDELNDVCQPFVPDHTRSQTTTGLPGLVIPTMNQICPDEVLPEDLLEVRYLLGVEDKTLAVRD